MSNTSESNILGIGRLRCELLSNPLGIDETAPRLSWDFSAPTPRRPVAYRVVAGAWETGRVDGVSTTSTFRGPELRSGQRVTWHVEAWDDEGELSCSTGAWFEMGLLHASDWVGSWIETEHSPALFRRAFTLPTHASHARLYITALGLYVASVNGRRVGTDVFTPGWTDYHRRLQYQAYDVTDLLVAGANNVQVEVADGWYAGYVGFLGREIYGDHPQLLAQLHVECSDASTHTIATDDTWLTAAGTRREADLLMGETVDARATSTEWQPAHRGPGTSARLISTSAPPTRAVAERAVVARHEPAPGVHVFDIGQNLSGWVRLRARGPAGTEITLRFAEVCNDDGTIYTQNLRTARATDHFILAGTGEDEVFEPAFTFHGFRYVEVTGYPGELLSDGVTAVVATADLEQTGDFECDDPALNQLQSNIAWGQRGNFLEVPTDCPQRDERLGWTGDAQVFAATACFNADVNAFLARWMVDMVDAQADDGAFPVVVPRLSGPNPEENDGAPGWGDAGVIVPWTLYVRYGDRRLLERCFDAMARWVDHVENANPDLLWKQRRHGDMGDWLSIDAESPKEVLGTSFFARSADLVARAAVALERSDADHHRARADAIVAAFRAAYVSADGRVTGDTQTIYALALRFGLLTPDVARLTADHLVADIEARGDHISTGFLGVAHLLPALTDAGYVDVAYRLLHQNTYPSWGYAVANGATTIWERWDGWTEENGFQDPAMNSFNHYAFGSVGEWLYESVIGIQPVEDAPGYERVVIAPHPGGRLHRAEAHYRSAKGPIAVRWERDEERFVLDVTIPNGCRSADVYVPGETTARVVEPGSHHFESLAYNAKRFNGPV